MDKFIPPQLNSSSFHCPWCKVLAHQDWTRLEPRNEQLLSIWNVTPSFQPADLSSSRCSHCRRFSLWADDKLILPPSSTIPQPEPDTPENVASIYREAMSVYPVSSRATAALLRLAVQMLLVHLGGKGRDINSDIGTLVKDGLPIQIQQALDIVRIIGNNAVHPGVIDFDDTPEISATLFELINIIVREMITRPKEIENFYQTLPQNLLSQIEKRDKTGT